MVSGAISTTGTVRSFEWPCEVGFGARGNQYKLVGSGSDGTKRNGNQVVSQCLRGAVFVDNRLGFSENRIGHQQQAQPFGAGAPGPPSCDWRRTRRRSSPMRVTAVLSSSTFVWRPRKSSSTATRSQPVITRVTTASSP